VIGDDTGFDRANPPGMSRWGPLADFGERLIATLLDAIVSLIGLVVILVLGVVLWLVTGRPWASLAVAAVVYAVLTAYSIYTLFMTGECGSSPGKRLMGLKVVRLSDGQVLGGPMGIIRGLAHVIDSLAYVGYLFPLWDPLRQTLADKIVGTVVLTGQTKEPFSAQIFRLRSAGDVGG
jgi:uncharacterized RDD family membrane protein YckC